MSDQPQTTAIVDGLDALRWLLNISAAKDRPRSQIGSLLDRHFMAGGQTVRQSLEEMWQVLAKEHADAK